MSNLADIRREYVKNKLNKASVQSDPIAQFNQWYEEAVSSDIMDASAMHLATCDASGKPSIRVVLLKGIEEGNFLFFTNYDSKKGHQLEVNPQAALNFYWMGLERQIRLEGRVKKVSKAVSETYFQSRPRSSQIAAWASQQSKKLSNRAEIEELVKKIEAKYESFEKLPLPPNWGGYAFTPNLIEFWQGRESRLHDRIQYARIDGSWVLDRLAP